jgi:hypothetical protein
MSCSECLLLLKELNLACINESKTCTKDELNKQLKHALLKLHPDKGGNSEDFKRFYDCIKYILDNYECYDYEHDYCNPVTHKTIKAKNVQGKCIKFRSKKNKDKKVQECPEKGYFWRKGWSTPKKCIFPHNSFKKAAMTEDGYKMSAIIKNFDEPYLDSIKLFYSKMLRKLQTLDMFGDGHLVLSDKKLPSKDEFKKIFKPLGEFNKLTDQVDRAVNGLSGYKYEHFMNRLETVYTQQASKIDAAGMDMMQYFLKHYPHLTEEDIKSRIVISKRTRSKRWNKDVESFIKVFRKYPYILNTKLMVYKKSPENFGTFL